MEFFKKNTIQDLNKFHNVYKTIKLNTPCYLIAKEWYQYSIFDILQLDQIGYFLSRNYFLKLKSQTNINILNNDYYIYIVYSFFQKKQSIYAQQMKNIINQTIQAIENFLFNNIKAIRTTEKLSNQPSKYQSLYQYSWGNFEFFYRLGILEGDHVSQGSAGPINNTSLVNLTSKYKKMIKPNESKPMDETKLFLMDDWNEMKLKTGLKYNDDVVIVSTQVWNFLYDIFGGGPQIELMSEPLTTNEISGNYVTMHEESNIDCNIMVNLDTIYVSFQNLKKIYHVSPTLPIENLHKWVCKDANIDYTIAEIYQVQNNTNLVTIKDLKNIQDGACFVIKINEEKNMSKNQLNEHIEENMEASTNVNHEDGLKGEFLMEKQDDYQLFSDNDSLKTVSTAWKSENKSGSNTIGFGDEQFQNYENFNALPINNPEIINNILPSPSKLENTEIKKDIIQKEMISMIKRAKHALYTDKIRLENKTIKQIKSSIAHIQNEWSSYKKSKISKKIT